MLTINTSDEDLRAAIADALGGEDGEITDAGAEFVVGRTRIAKPARARDLARALAAAKHEAGSRLTELEARLVAFLGRRQKGATAADILSEVFGVAADSGAESKTHLTHIANIRAKMGRNTITSRQGRFYLTK